ncbi:hypothetical protein [Listeria cornellensis]|uniref:Uncharacterized protein n=1 Tax=Listeria cornellensis FSL F6-0969 TaxID=1265820 RepID=W7C3U0_9LIST|nr:hypothetical protein [Listeria cornellensis]EUJ27318.1 hypothetical protein PCORN_13342 [Listeria cornellensis FSL F6-0969]
METVKLQLGEKEYTIKIKTSEKEEYQKLIITTYDKLNEAKAFNESVEILKFTVDRLLGKDGFIQLFDQAGESVLNTMAYLHEILEAVSLKVFDDVEENQIEE